MAEYLIQGETLNSLADRIRTLSGTENLLGIVAMTEKIDEANTEISEQTDLIAQMNTALDDLGAVAGGGGSGGLETCEVTIKQQWGGNDDPEYLVLYATAYTIENGTPVASDNTLTSRNDLASEHSVTLTMYKNVPFLVVTFTGMVSDAFDLVTASASGGTIGEPFNLYGEQVLSWQLTPTADTATFTFSSP